MLHEVILVWEDRQYIYIYMIDNIDMIDNIYMLSNRNKTCIK